MVRFCEQIKKPTKEIGTGRQNITPLENCADTILPTALAHAKTGGRGVGNNITPDGLGRVLGKAHPVGVGHDLVGNQNGHTKLLGQAGELTQKLGHLHLTFRQFATSGVVGTEEGRGGIDDDEGVTVLAEDGGGDLQKFHLMLAVVGAGVGDVLEGGDGVHVEPLGNGLEPFGAEGALGIDVHGLAFRSTVGDGQLARDAQSVAQLGLAGAEFAKDLGDTAGLDATLEQLVQFDGTGGELQHGLAILEGVGGRLEVGGDHGLDNLLDLEDLGLGDALDVRQLADGGVGDGFDGVVAGILQLLEFVGVDPVLGEAVQGLEGDSDLLCDGEGRVKGGEVR